MRKFLKNVALSILIIYFMLSVVTLIVQVVKEYTVVIPGIIQIAEEVQNKGLSGEEGYELLASLYYYAGYANKIEVQIGILIISFVFGIFIGLVVTFEEESKLKFFLKYIVCLLIIALYSALFEAFEYMSFKEIVGDIITVIGEIWVGYTLAFAAGYAIKIYINNKKTKELNEILKNKKDKK